MKQDKPLSILRSTQLSEKEIEKHCTTKSDWKIVSKYQELSEEFIKKHDKEICLKTVFTYQNVSDYFLTKYKYYGRKVLRAKHYCGKNNDVFVTYADTPDILFINGVGYIINDVYEKYNKKYGEFSKHANEYLLCVVSIVSALVIDYNEMIEDDNPIEYIEKRIGMYEISWERVSYNVQYLSDEFIIHFKVFLNWDLLTQNKHISENVINTCIDMLTMNSGLPGLHRDIIRKYWRNLSFNGKEYTEDFLSKWKGRIDMCNMFEGRVFSETLLEELLDYGSKNHLGYDYDEIWIYHKCSEEFIERNIKYVRWVYVLGYQKLSKDFIDEHFDKMFYKGISQYTIRGLIQLIEREQNLTKSYIREKLEHQYKERIVFAL